MVGEGVTPHLVQNHVPTPVMAPTSEYISSIPMGWLSMPRGIQMDPQSFLSGWLRCGICLECDHQSA